MVCLASSLLFALGLSALLVIFVPAEEAFSASWLTKHQEGSLSTAKNDSLWQGLASVQRAASKAHENITGRTPSPAPRSEPEQQIIDAYKRTNEAVVNVSTRTRTRDFFNTMYQDGSGSGVIVDATNGYVITNYHVIANAEKAAVTLADGSAHSVKLVGLDGDLDLALLQIVEPPDSLVAAPLGDSSQVEVGQRVLAIGNPFGLERTLTTGIISSLGRTIKAQSGRIIEDIIQTDAAINPGNSGGPLLDTAGRIIAINTAILSSTGQNSGIGLAIPVNQIKEALPQLIQYGEVRKPKMGVIIRNTKIGPVLLYVHPQSPADRAGLSGAVTEYSQGGKVYREQDFSKADFIVAVNGKRVQSKEEIISILSSVKEGETIDLIVRKTLIRGKTRKVSLKPEIVR